jgi:tetratricopeptide (TPR) repeat protein
MLLLAIAAACVLLVLPSAGAGEEAWTLEVLAAKRAIAMRDYAEAAARFSAALVLAETPPIDDRGVLGSLRGLSGVLRIQGKLEEAQAVATRAVPVAARLHGDQSPELGAVLSELGRLQRARGLRQDAIFTLQSAVAIGMKDVGSSQDELASDLTVLGILQSAINDTTAAKDTFYDAIAAWERAQGPDTLQLLPVLDAAGALHRDTSGYEAAETLYLRALRLRESASGPDSAELLGTLDSLAYVYFGQKKYGEAEPVYIRLAALWESSAGPEHPMLALTLDKMTEFYVAQERYADAEPLAARALGMRVKLLLQSSQRSGRLQVLQRKIPEAEDLLRRTVRAGEELQAPDESLEAPLRAHAAVLRELGREGDAVALDKRIRAMAIRRADTEGRRLPPPSTYEVVK